MKNSKKQTLAAVIFLIFCSLSLIQAIEDFKIPSSPPPIDTVITSDRVEMDSKDDSNIFNFYGNVHLTGEGLDAVCDQLEVISKKTEGNSSDLGNSSSFEKITAVGHIKINREDRTIRAGHAIIFPEEGKVVLTDHPEVTDSQGTVTGDKITFYKNDGKAYVEGGSQGGRPKIILPNLPNLKKDSISTQKIEKTDAQTLTPKKL